MNGKPELTIEYLVQGVHIVLVKPFALTIVCKQKTPNYPGNGIQPKTVI
jgi:hypothetical protein